MIMGLESDCGAKCEKSYELTSYRDTICSYLQCFDLFYYILPLELGGWWDLSASHSVSNIFYPKSTGQDKVNMTTQLIEYLSVLVFHIFNYRLNFKLQSVNILRLMFTILCFLILLSYRLSHGFDCYSTDPF